MKKLILLLIGILIVVALASYAILFWNNPTYPEKNTIIYIPKGSSVASVADSLSAHHLIRSKFFFKLAARIEGAGSKIQPGSYRIAQGLSNAEILSRLTGTEFALIFEITIPEGSSIRKIASIAKDKLGLDSSLIVKIAHDQTYLRGLGIPKEAKSAEGFLFPDTYRFFLMMTPQELVKRMVDRFNEVITDSLLATNQTKLSRYEVITFASIVEAEAHRPDERDTIAGVYLNRLKIGMKLDADPTIGYGLQLNRPVDHDDLLKENPYNTYQIVGLPPGPINNPGKAAIIAALHPAHHDKIYFVARRDGSGGHYFSKTIAEQERMIKLSNRNQNE
jgi:UPF0755 protein